MSVGLLLAGHGLSSSEVDAMVKQGSSVLFDSGQCLLCEVYAGNL